jgi:hypothetical protein
VRPPDLRSDRLRVAFVGRAVEDAWAVPSQTYGTLVPTWVEHREGADGLAEALRDAEPDVVVVFRPHRVPAGVITETGKPALAVLPDPIGFPWGDFEVWNTDLEYFPGAIEVSGGPDALVPPFPRGEYARVIACDPHIARVKPELGVWRSPPLPVDDALFVDPRPPARPPRPLFIGESSEQREQFLIWPKHGYDLSHYASGLAGERLRNVLARTNVGVTLRPLFHNTFHPMAPLHLAAGHLLVTQPLVPSRGLEPGLDHVQIEAPDQLMRVLDQLRDRPAAYDRVRIRGRFKAEGFRASRVWPRLLGDFALDLAAAA